MHAGALGMKHKPGGPQFPCDSVKVRIVALDGAPFTLRDRKPHEEFEFTASVSIMLQAQYQQPIV